MRKEPSDFAPWDPAFVQDPYATYRVLRERPTATFNELDKSWLVTRFTDVQRVFRDHETFSSNDRFASVAVGLHRPRSVPNIIASDPPEHTKLRRFLARCTRAYELPGRAEIERLVDQLLDAGFREGRIDLMGHLAFPLPLMLTARMLGIDESEWRRVGRWADVGMTATHDRISAEDREVLRTVSAEMPAFFRSTIEALRLRGEKGSSLLDALVFAADNAGISTDEVVEMAGQLVQAGSFTISHLIGNGVLALLKHRSELDALRERPELWSSATDELVRHSGPVQAVFRFVRRPVTIHGVALEPGARLNVVIASANRDERRFAAPDVLRLDRDARDQVAFGDGIHRCFGAQFGRLQARVAIERLLERAPLIARVDLLSEPEWRSTWAIRGLGRLWLRGGPRSVPSQKV